MRERLACIRIVVFCFTIGFIRENTRTKCFDFFVSFINTLTSGALELRIDCFYKIGGKMFSSARKIEIISLNGASFLALEEVAYHSNKDTSLFFELTVNSRASRHFIIFFSFIQLLFVEEKKFKNFKKLSDFLIRWKWFLW